jgi:hypothetical protein
MIYSSNSRSIFLLKIKKNKMNLGKHGFYKQK